MKDEQDILTPGGEERTKFISDVFLWTNTRGHTSSGRPAKTYIHLLGVRAVSRLEDNPMMMMMMMRESLCYWHDDYDDV